MAAAEIPSARGAASAGLGIGIVPVHMVGDALQRRERVQSAIYLVHLPNRTLPSRVSATDRFSREGCAPPPVRGKWVDEYRRSADYVVSILHDANAADLAIERPTWLRIRR